jgi:hypothetical protein
VSSPSAGFPVLKTAISTLLRVLDYIARVRERLTAAAAAVSLAPP